MLNAAHAAMVEFGVLAPTDRFPPFWARMSGNLVLMAYPRCSQIYLVKIAIRARLDREFRGLSIAHSALPRNVPRPLGLTMQRTFQVFVAQGIPHEQLVFRRDGAGMRVFQRGLEALLAASLNHFRASPADRGVDAQDALHDVSDALGWAGWRAYWGRIGPVIASLPRILQHGDLAMTNIAVADGELIFFDWEDFGLVDLIGFDLAVALLSLNHFDAARLRERLAEAHPEAELTRRGCARLNLPTDLFLELFPVYLSVFVKIKQRCGYDPEVSKRAIAALQEWVRAGPPRLGAGTAGDSGSSA